MRCSLPVGRLQCAVLTGRELCRREAEDHKMTAIQGRIDVSGLRPWIGRGSTLVPF